MLQFRHTPSEGYNEIYFVLFVFGNVALFFSLLSGRREVILFSSMYFVALLPLVQFLHGHQWPHLSEYDKRTTYQDNQLTVCKIYLTLNWIRPSG